MRRESSGGFGGGLSLIIGAVFIGFAPIWVRWSEVGPIATAAHRLSLAVPFLGIWALRERVRQDATRRLLLLRPDIAGWIIAAGIFFALDLAVWHLSIRFTTVANATLLGNLAPIFVAIGAWWFLGESIGKTFLLGMTIALAGAWLLTRANLRLDPGRLRGDVLGVSTALFYGGYQLCVARLRRDLPSARLLFWSSMVAIPFLWIAALISGEVLIPLSLRGWGVLLGLALTAQVAGQGLITYGFAHLPAGLSSLTLLVQPLVAAIAGSMLLNETFGGSQWLGGLVLLSGIYLSRRRTVSVGADAISG